MIASKFNSTILAFSSHCGYYKAKTINTKELMLGKPIIGIPLDHVNVTKEEGGKWYSNINWYALRSSYIEALKKVTSSTVICLPYDHSNISSYVEMCDGMLFTSGGFDLDPKLWGAKKHQKTFIKPERSNFEMELLKAYYSTQKPILGICAGMQLLNVYKGGSIFQHLPEDVTSEINHAHRDPDVSAHSVNVKDGSVLGSMMIGRDVAHINSSHHQAINKVGSNLIETAWAKDGVIEAIEAIDHPFALGVQWHPERLVDEIDTTILQMFCDACV